MAGYLMSLDSEASLQLYARFGVYATKLSEPNGRWQGHHEGTFADYVTMRPGDNIYFFIKRRIYGIGELTAVDFDCKFQNFATAGIPHPQTRDEINGEILWDNETFSPRQRWLCTFKPAPHFFSRGLDMDDLLGSNPRAFRMLRTFWKLSFIKFDDEENQAFRDALLRRNEDLLDQENTAEIFPSEWRASHAGIRRRLRPHHRISASPILAACAIDDALPHEMAIEAGLLGQISTLDPETTAVFGAMDYCHHQVPASPFKPVDYMDRMDVFGYAFVPGFKPTRATYLVAELKKDLGTIVDVEQLLKYVDWVRDEYASGDYSMIRAYLVAHDFEPECIENAPQLAKRRFVVGRRPPKSLEWSALKLVRYRYDNRSQKLQFSVVAPQ